MQYPNYDAIADIEIINNNVKKLVQNAEEQDIQIKSKEPIIDKKTGFNLDKTDLTENDSNKLFSAKGALNLFNTLTTNFTNAINTAKEALRGDIVKKLDKGSYIGDAQSLKDDIDTKEPKINKNNGFNKTKSDATNLEDSETLATSMAVAKTMEKAVEAYSSAKGKEPAFNKSTAFNKNFGVGQNEVLEGSKLAEILGIEYGGVLNNNNQKVPGKGYYDTANKKIYKCTANTSINYADAGYFIEVSNNDLLGKLQNLDKINNLIKFPGNKGIKFYNKPSSTGNYIDASQDFKEILFVLVGNWADYGNSQSYTYVNSFQQITNDKKVLINTIRRNSINNNQEYFGYNVATNQPTGPATVIVYGILLT